MTKCSKPILIVDTREKTPWDFESDDAFEAVKHQKLDGGDYSIEGMEHLIVIERKASANELFVNFSDKREKARIQAEFERLKDHRFKIIIIEENLEDIMNPQNYYVNKRGINKQSPKMPVAVVTNKLTELMLQENVFIIFGGRKAQNIARGILLKAHTLYNAGKL